MQELTTAKRPAPPHAWKPGTSGNPAGRPKGAAGVAKMIARETRDGAELVEFALKLLRNAREDGQPAGYSLDDQKWAMGWLSDRGLGKAVQAIDLHQSAEPHSPQVDVSGMADADLAALVQVLELADGQGEVEDDFRNALDVECVEP